MEAIAIATGYELRTTPENQLLAHPSEMLGVWGESARRPLVNTQATRLRSGKGALRMREFMGSRSRPAFRFVNARNEGFGTMPLRSALFGTGSPTPVLG